MKNLISLLMLVLSAQFASAAEITGCEGNLLPIVQLRAGMLDTFIRTATEEASLDFENRYFPSKFVARSGKIRYSSLITAAGEPYWRLQGDVLIRNHENNGMKPQIWRNTGEATLRAFEVNSGAEQSVPLVFTGTETKWRRSWDVYAGEATATNGITYTIKLIVSPKRARLQISPK